MRTIAQLISGILAACLTAWLAARSTGRRRGGPAAAAGAGPPPEDREAAPPAGDGPPDRPPPRPPAAPTIRVPAVFVLSMLSSLGLAVLYARGGQPQLEGILLALSLGGLGAGIILWAKELLPPEQVEDIIESETSPAAARQAAVAALERGEAEIARRHLLAALLGGALGALGIAALFPIRSLGPGPGRSLFRTEWTPGALVVTETGRPVGVRDLNVGSVITVFPDGHVGSPISQTVLIRVDPSLLRLPPDRLAWAPQGCVAYSKVCTHAGCPVGLYQRSTHQLLCPCHQSTFDVLRGAVRVFGPAVRPLPQLPLEIDADGRLRARSDFPEPVGPGFWNEP
jgi:ubiquinol-cytochrome c reductase iron-sulfur subunit